MNNNDLKAMAKENYLLALDQKPTYWQPIENEALEYTGFEFCSFEKGPAGGGLDGFGVKWARPRSFGGAATPVTTDFVLKDISDWKTIPFPDIDEYDWENEARILKNVDRGIRAVDYGSGNGPFERLAALMGFENALVSIACEPEEVERFFAKITNWKVEIIHKVKKYFNPDTFTLYDDVCTQRSPFISPQTYRDLIMPCHKKIFNACKEEGIRPVLHCCGLAESLVPYFVEAGAVCWASVQPCNNIPEILKKYGNKICLSGGYNTNGSPGCTEDEAVIKQEIVRCYEEYGPYHGYIFSGAAFKPEIETDDGYDVWEPSFKVMKISQELAHKNAGYDFPVEIKGWW